MNIHRTLTPVGVKTAVALGYFDGMHRGHEEIIEQTLLYARQMRLCATVFTFDFSFSRPGEKGRGDIFSKEIKYHEMERLGIELVVEIPFSEISGMSGKNFILKVLGHGCLNAAVVSCGEDFRFGKGRDCGTEVMERYSGPRGIRVNVVPFVIDDGVISTTRIKRLITSGDIPTAVRLIGRPYIIDLPTVKKEVGIGINYSSASQRMDVSLELPRFGVYTSRTQVDGVWYDSVTYIGTRPTKGSDGVYADTNVFMPSSQTCEAKSVAVELVRLMRPEEKFQTQGALKEAIIADIERAKMRL
ncbi:MAG: hypothetical protein FWE66_04585 [Oscillospiraceae bacterium]|nr:hypothetical protein [Oscillospiraceae bacterium]